MPTAPATKDPLHRYRTKRDFGKTPEPRGVRGRPGKALSFVIQKHAATRLHSDFRQRSKRLPRWATEPLRLNGNIG